ncbi:MAG: DNA/RNA nuclease SfsA [Clostridia bacterium]|nr:DNA/RNA nuclease SfsA [Clostridia bacterium]MBQ6703885.1 DNA/RNA nuclease SfsA [Clostridia bacterium]
MNYPSTVTAAFISRPNRFIAKVELEGRTETVHVKNTGRCKELLIPGARVVLAPSANPARKTRYDLIGVYSRGILLNMDSQAPNAAAKEYLAKLYPGADIKAEYRHGDSRLDFYIERAGEKPLFVEVKGVTLFEGDTAMFPDAPTERGVKHIRHLIACAERGAEAMILFMVQLKGVSRLIPNDATHPRFGAALRDAAEAGVIIKAVDCIVTEGSMTADKEITVDL